MSRSDLVGWLEDGPLCLDCLTAEAPALGWALQLVEAAALALAGRWPRKAQNRELPILLELVRGIRAAVGPIEHRNRRIPLALDLLDVIGRRDGGEVCLKVLEVLDVAGRAGGGALAAELLDVTRHHRTAKPRGTTRGRVGSGRVAALRHQLAAAVRREPPGDADLAELAELLDRIGLEPVAVPVTLLTGGRKR